MRRRFGRRFGRKRSVSWIDGFSSYDDANGVQARLLSFAGPIADSTNTWGVAVQLTVPADFALIGGEDAVMTRIVGRVAFVEGRRNAGAGLAAMGFQARLVVYQPSLVETAVGGAVFNRSFTLSSHMGDETIMWMRDTVVSPTAIGVAGAGYELMVGNHIQWVDVDIRAQRKLQVDKPVAFLLQAVFAAGTIGADCRMLGGLRMLVKRPR